MLETLSQWLTRWFRPATAAHAHSSEAEPETAEVSRLPIKAQAVPAETAENAEAAQAHIVPYDETLLERTRLQWQQGDWESLAHLDIRSIEHHPDRAELALLAAAGRLQTGNDAKEARQLIRLSQDWGIDRNLMSQTLTIGVHNSIGRAFALADHQERALQHFECAISMRATGSAKALVANERARQGFDALGLLSGRHGFLQTSQNELTSQSVDALSIAKTPCSIKINDSALKAYSLNIPREDFIDEYFDVADPTQTKDVLVIFSTPRSGSTLLCDILRKNHACIPHEYFQPFQYLPKLAKRWDCIDNEKILVDKYIKSLCHYRTFSNGWLGINLHGSHIPVFMSMRKQFCNLRFRYIHLVRRDILGQSISFNLALQTGLWTEFFSPIDKNITPVFNLEAIDSARKDIESQNRMIKSYIENNKIDCQEFFYEDLLSNWNENSLAISSIFGFDTPFVFTTNLKKQTNQLTTEWRNLYNEEFIKKEINKNIGSLEFIKN